MLCLRIVLEIDVRVGMRIARQELLDSKRSGTELRADQDDVAESSLHQRDSPKDEGAHQDLAQLEIGLHQEQ